MQTTVIDQLDLVERQFNQVAVFLAAGDAPHLQAAAAMLQVLSLELPKLMPTTQMHTPSGEMRRRVQTMAKGLQMLRDNLSRQAALNLQALKVVMPTPSKSTYSTGSSVYGTVGAQSGEFRVVAA